MSGTLSLNGTWGLTYAEGSPLMVPRHYTGTMLQGRQLLRATVPAPIHLVLQQAGIIEDPNVGMNSLKARWVEEQFWIYRHTFTAPEAVNGRVWLVFEKLELEAIVWLNGVEVGQHANAHRPARFDVTDAIQTGDNLLVVQLTTGMHSVADKSAAYTSDNISKLTGRAWHRHPQYQSGWDWNARLVNVGILGDVRLEWHAAPRLDQVTVFAVPSADLSTASLTARATVDNCTGSEQQAVLRVRVVESGQEISRTVTLAPGENRPELRVDITNPQLWWPLGHGEQYRYTVEVTLETGGETQAVTRKTGIRRVEMDQSPHPVEGRYCFLRINNHPIFCKGGNWVPADLLYSTVDAARYRELVQIAVAANFNTLRIWGGALFADPALCEACDEMGVMIWHDFLFACAKYPGDDPEFSREVGREVTYAVREMAHHPSLVVWCGNNEIEWGDWSWGYDDGAPTHPHYVLFHRDIPRIVTAEDPSTLHWISSPWSPDYKLPNDPTVGDQHPWSVSMDAGGADWWNYRRYVDRFPNEGGVLGASSPATLRQFLPANEQRPFSLSWDHHDNPFAANDSVPGALGHALQTVSLWTGLDPMALALDDYAFLSGLLQAEGLQEYINNYRRRMYSSGSAIFWMYNDSWPVTNGWTIVDYYLRRKLSYHPVRRAFQPISVVVAGDEGQVTVYGVNDTPHDWSGELHYGLFMLDGQPPAGQAAFGVRPVDERIAVTLPANSSTALAATPLSVWQSLDLARTGAFARLEQQQTLIAQHRLFLKRFNELRFVEPHIHLSLQHEVLTLTSDAFAWGVSLDVDGERALVDNCIDLLPGCPYSMKWPAILGEPVIINLGNRYLSRVDR